MAALSHDLNITTGDFYKEPAPENVIDRYNFNDFNVLDKSLDNIFNNSDEIMVRYSTREEKQRIIILYKTNYMTMYEVLEDNKMNINVNKQLEKVAASGDTGAGGDDKEPELTDLQRDIIKSLKVVNYKAIEERKIAAKYQRLYYLQTKYKIVSEKGKAFIESQGIKGYLNYFYKVFSYKIVPTILAGGAAGVGIAFQMMIISDTVTTPKLWVNIGKSLFGTFSEVEGPNKWKKNKMNFSYVLDILGGLNIFTTTQTIQLKKKFEEVLVSLDSPELIENLKVGNKTREDFIEKVIMVTFGIKYNNESGVEEVYTLAKFNQEFPGITYDNEKIASFFKFIKGVITEKDFTQKLESSDTWLNFIAANIDSPKVKFAYAALGLAMPIFGYIQTTLNIFNTYKNINQNIAFQGIKGMQQSYIYKDTTQLASEKIVGSGLSLLEYVCKENEKAKMVFKCVGMVSNFFGINSETFSFLINSAIQSQVNFSINDYFNKIMKEEKDKKKLDDMEEKNKKDQKEYEGKVLKEIEDEILLRGKYIGEGKTNEQIAILLDKTPEEPTKFKFFLSRLLIKFSREFKKFSYNPAVYINSLITTLFTAKMILHSAYISLTAATIVDFLPKMVLNDWSHRNLWPYLDYVPPLVKDKIKNYITGDEPINFAGIIASTMSMYYGLTSDEVINKKLKEIETRWINEIVSDITEFHNYLQSEFFKSKFGMSIQYRLEKMNNFIVFRIFNTCCKYTYSLAIMPSIKKKITNLVPKYDFRFIEILKDKDKCLRFMTWLNNKIDNINLRGNKWEDYKVAFWDFLDLRKILYDNVVPYLAMDQYYETNDYELDLARGKIIKTPMDQNIKISEEAKKNLQKKWESSEPGWMYSYGRILLESGLSLEDLYKDKSYGLQTITIEKTDENGNKYNEQQVISIDASTVISKFASEFLGKITGAGGSNVLGTKLQDKHEYSGYSQAKTGFKKELEKVDQAHQENPIKYFENQFDKMVEQNEFQYRIFQIQFVKYSEYKKTGQPPISSDPNYQGDPTYDSSDDFDYLDFLRWIQMTKQELIKTETTTVEKAQQIALEIALIDESLLFASKQFSFKALDIGQSVWDNMPWKEKNKYLIERVRLFNNCNPQPKNWWSQQARRAWNAATGARSDESCKDYDALKNALGLGSPSGTNYYAEFIKQTCNKSDYKTKDILEILIKGAKIDLVLPHRYGVSESSVLLSDLLDFQEKMDFLMEKEESKKLIDKIEELESLLAGDNPDPEVSIELAKLRVKYDDYLKEVYKKIGKNFGQFFKFFGVNQKYATVKLWAMSFNYSDFSARCIELIKKSFPNTLGDATKISNLIQKNSANMTTELSKIIKRCSEITLPDGTITYIYVTVGSNIDIFTGKVINESKCNIDPADADLKTDDLEKILFTPEVIIYLSDPKNHASFSRQTKNVIKKLNNNLFKLVIDTTSNTVEQEKLKRESLKKELKDKEDALSNLISAEKTNDATKLQLSEEIKQLTDEILKCNTVIYELDGFTNYFSEYAKKSLISSAIKDRLYAYLSFNFIDLKIASQNNSTPQFDDLNVKNEFIIKQLEIVDEKFKKCDDSDLQTKKDLIDFLDGLSVNSEKIQLSDAKNPNDIGGIVPYQVIIDLGYKKLIKSLEKVKNESITLDNSITGFKHSIEKYEKEIKGQKGVKNVAKSNIVTCKQLQSLSRDVENYYNNQYELYKEYRKTRAADFYSTSNTNIDNYKKDVKIFADGFNRDLTALHKKYLSRIKPKPEVSPGISTVGLNPSTQTTPSPNPDDSDAGKTGKKTGPGGVLKTDEKGNTQDQQTGNAQDVTTSEMEKEKADLEAKQKLENKQEQEQALKSDLDYELGNEEKQEEELQEELQMMLGLLFGSDDFFNFISSLLNLVPQQNMSPETPGLPEDNDLSEKEDYSEKNAKDICKENKNNWWIKIAAPEKYVVIDPYSKKEAKGCSNNNYILSAISSITSVIVKIANNDFLKKLIIALLCSLVGAGGGAYGGLKGASSAFMACYQFFDALFAKPACTILLGFSYVNYILKNVLASADFKDTNLDLAKSMLLTLYGWSYYGLLDGKPDLKDECDETFKQGSGISGWILQVLGGTDSIEAIKGQVNAVMRNLIVKDPNTTNSIYGVKDPLDYNLPGIINLGNIDDRLAAYNASGAGDLVDDTNIFSLFALFAKDKNKLFTPEVHTQVEDFNNELKLKYPDGNVTVPAIYGTSLYDKLTPLSAILLLFSDASNIKENLRHFISYITYNCFNFVIPPEIHRTTFWMAYAFSGLTNAYSWTVRVPNFFGVFLGDILSGPQEIILVLLTCFFGNKSVIKDGNYSDQLNLVRDRIEYEIFELRKKYTDPNSKIINKTALSDDVKMQFISLQRKIMWAYRNAFKQVQNATDPKGVTEFNELISSLNKKGREDALMSVTDIFKYLTDDLMLEDISIKDRKFEQLQNKFFVLTQISSIPFTGCTTNYDGICFWDIKGMLTKTVNGNPPNAERIIKRLQAMMHLIDGCTIDSDVTKPLNPTACDDIKKKNDIKKNISFTQNYDSLIDSDKEKIKESYLTLLKTMAAFSIKKLEMNSAVIKKIMDDLKSPLAKKNGQLMYKINWAKVKGKMTQEVLQETLNELSRGGLIFVCEFGQTYRIETTPTGDKLIICEKGKTEEEKIFFKDYAEKTIERLKQSLYTQYLILEKKNDPETVFRSLQFIDENYSLLKTNDHCKHLVASNKKMEKINKEIKENKVKLLEIFTEGANPPELFNEEEYYKKLDETIDNIKPLLDELKTNITDISEKLTVNSTCKEELTKINSVIDYLKGSNADFHFPGGLNSLTGKIFTLENLQNIDGYKSLNSFYSYLLEHNKIGPYILTDKEMAILYIFRAFLFTKGDLDNYTIAHLRSLFLSKNSSNLTNYYTKIILGEMKLYHIEEDSLRPQWEINKKLNSDAFRGLLSDMLLHFSANSQNIGGFEIKNPKPKVEMKGAVQLKDLDSKEEYFNLFAPPKDVNGKIITKVGGIDFRPLNQYGFFLETNKDGLMLSPWNAAYLGDYGSIRQFSDRMTEAVNKMDTFWIDQKLDISLDLKKNIRLSNNKFVHYEMGNFIDKGWRQEGSFFSDYDLYEGPPPILYNYNCKNNPVEGRGWGGYLSATEDPIKLYNFVNDNYVQVYTDPQDKTKCVRMLKMDVAYLSNSYINFNPALHGKDILQKLEERSRYIDELTKELKKTPSWSPIYGDSLIELTKATAGFLVGDEFYLKKAQIVGIGDDDADKDYKSINAIEKMYKKAKTESNNTIPMLSQTGGPLLGYIPLSAIYYKRIMGEKIKITVDSKGIRTYSFEYDISSGNLDNKVIVL